jgi:DoxX-like family
MPAIPQSVPISKSKLWTARVLRAIVILFLLMDGIMKLIKPNPVVQGMTRLGYPMSLSVPVGITLLLCVALYALPRTTILGGLMLTGYLGGAVASQFRIGEPIISHVLFPVYFGIVIWAELYLRENRLKALIPVRSDPVQQ